jgi:sialate O-acetylesterase
MKIICTFLFALVSALLQTAATAEQGATVAMPFLSPLFTDNMVLQRDIKAPVWGWTEPGRQVTVRIQDKTAQATADSHGRWLARIGPLAAGGPYDLTISGPQNITLKSVLVGDVWVCSGQSNMEMGIGNVDNAEQEIAQANYPEIRLFTVPKKVAVEPQTTFAGQWLVCTPETVHAGGWNGFSAVGYFFGRTLHQQLHVPIGLIHTSWGGTPAEAWTSGEALSAMPDYRPAVAQMKQLAVDQQRGQADYLARMAAWWTKNDPGSAHAPGWADPAFNTAAWNTMPLPQNWENAGIPELSAFDGVVWFRKEIDLPASAVGKEALLHLGPIDDRDTTWINGVKVGGLDQWDIARNYRVPAGVLKPGRNVIAVRVLDTGGNGGIYGKPEQMALEISDVPPILLAGPWLYKASLPLAKAQPLPMNADNNPNVPTVLYNGMVAPLIPFGIKGAIWYQGESNAGKAYQYRTLLPTMIRDWRTRWGEGAFPFLIVQLANFMPTSPQPVEDAWAELREAQLMTAEKTPKTGLAVAIDIGDAKDIHPRNKQDVGKRLALSALAIAYGRKLEFSGPLYRATQPEEGKIRLRFDHVGGGLAARDGGRLTGFAIAGEDRHFVWADAVIDGSTIVVSSPLVPHPVAVRYAWAINPVANLINKEGLPASPFRTDSWPGITVNAH